MKLTKSRREKYVCFSAFIDMFLCYNEWKAVQYFCGYRFPNMVVATISRSSVRRALLKGIGAEQIISFLKQHCHLEMYKLSSVVPRTVADQVITSKIIKTGYCFKSAKVG